MHGLEEQNQHYLGTNNSHSLVFVGVLKKKKKESHMFQELWVA